VGLDHPGKKGFQLTPGIGKGPGRVSVPCEKWIAKQYDQFHGIQTYRKPAVNIKQK
jgi:hypothetical protein